MIKLNLHNHLTCLLRNLYAGQDAAVRTGHRTTDWFQIGKGVHQGSLLSLCLVNLYAEYIMRNAGLEEAQAGIKIAERNINNLRESLGLQGDPTSPSKKRSVLSVHWKDWSWSWNSNTLATWCKELTHLKRSWYWERLRTGGEGDNRGWDGWMASLTQCTWAWVNSRSLWWTGRPRCFGPWCLKESDTTEWLNWMDCVF